MEGNIEEKKNKGFSEERIGKKNRGLGTGGD